VRPEYDDIKKRIKETPKWYDFYGVPRYDEFSPKRASNIYAHEVILMEVECQGCKNRFLVEMNWNETDKILYNRESLRERILNKTIHYGDPPRHDEVECWAGETMNSIPIRIVEYWIWDKDEFKWKRDRSLEIELEE